MKNLLSWLFAIVMVSISCYLFFHIGYDYGRKDARSYFDSSNGYKLFYHEPVRAFEFKISKNERGLEIYAPNFIIDNSRRDTVFASKFILTTEITETP